MSNFLNRRYTPEEVSAIVRRALEKRAGDDGAVSYDELAETAREMNISPERLQAAIEEHEDSYELEKAREKVLRRRRSEFNAHLRSYLIVNGALIVINLLTTWYPWAIWPIVGWGIGLAFHASSALFPNERDVDRAARSLLRKQRYKRERDARKESDPGQASYRHS